MQKTYLPDPMTMNDIVFGVYGELDSPSLKVLRDLTITWSRYGFQGEIIEASTVDELLAVAVEKGFAYCLVQRAGHVIYEQWYLRWWDQINFFDFLLETIKQQDFLVLGERVVESTGAEGLVADCFLINLETYQRLGSPAFGDPGHHLIDGVAGNSVEKNGEVKLVPNGKVENTVAHGQGWGIVQASFSQQMPVLSFSDTINKERFDLATDRSDTFESLIRKAPDDSSIRHGLTSQEQSFLERVYDQIENARNGVFLFNVESYQDLVEQPDPIDGIFSVAAGFKAYRVLAVNGMTHDAQVVLYDYSSKALEVRKYIVDRWDGRHFPDFVKKVFNRYPEPDTFYQLWSGTRAVNIDWDDVDKFWQLELENWGGADQFQDHWQQYRKLPHTYMPVNLLTGREALFQKLREFRSPYLWWSNAFFTVYSNWLYSNEERQVLYEQWIEDLANAHPNCRINGADFNNSSVNGLKAGTYREIYWQNRPSDLLTSNFSDIEIRY